MWLCKLSNQYNMRTKKVEGGMDPLGPPFSATYEIYFKMLPNSLFFHVKLRPRPTKHELLSRHTSIDVMLILG